MEKQQFKLTDEQLSNTPEHRELFRTIGMLLGNDQIVHGLKDPKSYGPLIATLKTFKFLHSESAKNMSKRDFFESFINKIQPSTSCIITKKTKEGNYVSYFRVNPNYGFGTESGGYLVGGNKSSGYLLALEYTDDTILSVRGSNISYINGEIEKKGEELMIFGNGEQVINVITSDGIYYKIVEETSEGIKDKTTTELLKGFGNKK